MDFGRVSLMRPQSEVWYWRMFVLDVTILPFTRVDLAMFLSWSLFPMNTMYAFSSLYRHLAIP